MRNKRLDVLRCVAILLVLFSHAGINSNFVDGGWVGVDLFFVLSGFLISGLLFGEYRRRGDISFKRFLIRRGFKIYPAFYLFVLVTFLIQYAHHNVASGSEYFVEICYFQNYRYGVWLHTWSLAVEEHFYIVLPILLLLLIRFSSDRSDPFRALPGIFVAVAVACLVFRVVTVAQVPAASLLEMTAYRSVKAPTHERIDSLFFGVLLGYFQHFRPEVLNRVFGSSRNRLLLAVLAGVLVLPAFLLDQHNRFILTIGFTLLYVAFGIILMLCLNTHNILPQRLGTWLGSIGSIFAFVGMYSYSIYLWHESVLPWVPGLLRRVFHVRVPQAAYGPFYLVGSIAFGILLSRMIEYPALRLRDRLFPAMEPSLPAVGVMELVESGSSVAPTGAV